MFRSIELGRKIGKQEFKQEEERLRAALVEVQRQAGEAGIPLAIVIGGVDGAGKGATVNMLMEWMDPRGIDVHALEPPTDEERERPRLWRFWRRLPPKGRTAVFLGSWYTQPIVDRVYRRTGKAVYEHQLAEIARFESLLAAEGVLLLKFWLHLSKKDQKDRLGKLEADPKTRWRVTKDDWKNFSRYDRFAEQCAYAIEKTSTGGCPWFLVEGRDDNYRSVEVASKVVDRLREEIETRSASAKAGRKPPGARIEKPEERTVLDTLDLGLALSKKQYEKEMESLQARLNLLARRAYDQGKSAVLAFEGCDAAGKGGAIRRLVQAMHAKIYRIVPVAAPTDEERAQPYLWRFWRNLPRAGHLTIFDRTWYGRVLVERVEGFCREADWRRAFAEIRDFEDQLVDHGTAVVKFWLQISQEEQAKRFAARQEIAWKQHKITEEDWRNREKWPQYKEAISEMIERTDTSRAPWVLVEAEDKLWSRVKVVRTVCEALEGLVDGD